MANITKIYEVKLQGSGTLLDEMKKVNKEFENASKKWKELKKLIAAGGLSSADTAKYKEELNQAKLETEKLRQETIKLRNESLVLGNANKQQTADQKKANQETKNSTSAWKELLKQLNDARNNAKNIAVKFGIDSSEFKKAAAEANAFDKQVKQIESHLGQFQRNVGNYPGNQMLQGLNQNTLQALIKSGFGNIIANQVNLAKERTKELDQQFTLLKNKLDAVRTNATGDLDAIQREIIENRNAAQQLNREIARIQTEFRNATSMGARMTDSLKNYFKNLRTEVTTFLVGYLSFQAAMSKTQELITNTYELADGVTSMEVELQKAAGGAQNLVDKLALLDTRTKLPELVNIGNIAIKAGVEESDLAGVVSGIDKIKIAFGKDFGDVETGTESLIKLINVFENGEVTEDKMLRTGNAVRTIANESVASVPFLTDFAKRMAGLKGISELTLPAVFGMASGFEQFGQSAETTSTAIVRILPKIAADTEKFAKITKMSREEFSKLLNENPDQALIKVAEALTKDKAGMEELIKSMQDSDLAGKGGAGITSTLGVLGKNSETFQKSIKSAKSAYQDTSNITEAFTKKNENLSASMDKLKKGFVDAANNQKFQSFLKGVITLITFLGSAIGAIPFSVWIGLVTLLTLAYWQNIQALAISIQQTVVYAVRTVIGNALIAASTILLRAQTIVISALTIAWRGLNAIMVLMYGLIPGLRAAWISLNLTMMGLPIGWVIAGIVAIGAALTLMNTKAQDSAESMKKNGNAIKQTAQEMKIQTEIAKKANESTADTISKVEILTRILKDNTIAYDTKKKALKELIAISPQHLQALTLENMKTAEGTRILEEYRKKLLEVAKVKAVQSLIDEKQKRLTELENQATEDANNKLEADKYKYNAFDSRSWGEFGKGLGGAIGMGPGDSEDVYNNNLKERIRLQKELKDLSRLQANNVTAGLVSGFTGAGAGPAIETLTSLKSELDALNEQLDQTQTKTKRWYELRAEIDKKQAYYDSLTKTEKTKDKASNLTGTQKDFVKDLDASNKDRLSAIEDSYGKGKILEDDFIKKSLASNVKYFDSKIDYLKKGNAEERKQVAQAGFDKAKAEREANDKLFALAKKRTEDQLKNEESLIQKKRDKVVNDPYSSENQKLEAEKTFYEESTNAQIKYNQSMLDIQSDYNKKSIEDISTMFRALDEKLSQENKNTREYRIKTTKVSFNLSDSTADELTNANEIAAAANRKLIIQNKEISNAQKKIELEKIAARLELQNANVELGNAVAKIRLLEEEMYKRELTNDEMREFNRLLRERQLLEGKKAQAQQAATDSGAALPSGSGIPGSGASGLAASVTKAIGGKDGKVMIGDKDYSEQAGYLISEAFNVAQQSMNSYFDAERNRIEQSKQLAYERIDLEAKQLQRFAQSSAERESIENQTAEKKKKADKDAGEKLKKIKKSEAKIAFLMQLANIWSTAMQLGPIAGPIMGGVLSIIAGVQYASTIKGIDSTQYKRGGKFLGGGGKLNGPSHSDGGMPVYNPVTGEKVAEMEGKEGIINANSMNDSSTYTVSGTPSQIASKINSIGGGIDWDGGATMKKFLNGGTYLGSNLQAPIMKSYYENSNSAVASIENTERFNRIESKIEDLADLQRQESIKKVFVSGRDISEDQRERVKRSEIATL